MNQRWVRQLLSRRVLVILLLVIQGFILVQFILNTSQRVHWISISFLILSFLVALHILTSKKASYNEVTPKS